MRPRGLSVQLHRYGDTWAYGVVELGVTPGGGTRKRVLLRGAMAPGATMAERSHLERLLLQVVDLLAPE